jgi:hypothetical protein
MEVTKMPSPVYYVCAWSEIDSRCLCACDHQHRTIISAVACTGSACAGAYVVAVENGEYRELDETEEAVFQNLMYGSPERLQRLIRWIGRMSLIVS